MTRADGKLFLPDCSVLPPMETNGDHSRRHPRPAATPSEKPLRGQGSRFSVLNAFVDFTMGHLTRSEVLLWLGLYRDTRPNGLARTSQAELARRVGVNIRTIKRAVATLQGRGLLTVVVRGNLGQGPSAYRVHPLTKEKVIGALVPPS